MSLLHSTSDSSLSDSDLGYVTPVESFADDERLSDSKKVDPELQVKIVEQVEWYFSDENLLKDSFLMKHINRNKQGYVSLKLVSSLRKVKALSKDWQTVLSSLRHSTALSLNDDETKICRLTAAPQVGYTHVQRTLLVTNYSTYSEPQQIEQQFNKYGKVTLVRILHPGRAIPLDVKPSRSHHSELGREVCVLVEFESIEVARKASRAYLSQLSWRDDVKVTLLNTTSSKDGVKQTTKEGKRKRKVTADQSRWIQDDSRSPSPYLVTPPTKNTVVRKYLTPHDCDSGRGSSESPGNSPLPTKKAFLHPVWRKNDTSKDTGVIRTPLGPDGSRGFKSSHTVLISVS